jgi:hypothetical protein
MICALTSATSRARKVSASKTLPYWELWNAALQSRWKPKPASEGANAQRLQSTESGKDPNYVVGRDRCCVICRPERSRGILCSDTMQTGRAPSSAKPQSNWPAATKSKFIPNRSQPHWNACKGLCYTRFRHRRSMARFPASSFLAARATRPPQQWKSAGKGP